MRIIEWPYSFTAENWTCIHRIVRRASGALRTTLWNKDEQHNEEGGSPRPCQVEAVSIDFWRPYVAGDHVINLA